MKKFEFLSHVADAYIAAYGSSLEEAFENAALSLTEVMTDPNTISTTIEDDISISAHDEKALLYGWLEQLILNFDIDEKIYSRFKVIEILQNDGNWKLTAKAYGETFDPSRHPSKTEIKAVTYHQMEIQRSKDCYVAKFILDL